MKQRSLLSLILKRRTVRLFKPKKVPFRIIRKLIDSARCAPSAANLQFLEYLVIDSQKLREKIFPYTRWGGYVYPKRVPPPEKSPSLYVILLINKEKSKKPDLRDVGAAAENILLSLLCFGLGGCWIVSIDRKMLRKILNIPKKYVIDSLIAVGVPAEFPILENKDSVRYWLDRQGRLHVPKRPLEKIFHYNTIK
ncbi:MAG: nitroreductase family protein [Candidatus Omnitrophica bacterium]|nr:nitroreductase family protein [Candidatus Omnitrophota bacterium]